MEELMKIDPRQVRRLRDARAWSQEHLAAAAGVSARTIQRVESEGTASHETRLAIAAAFNVAAASLAPDDRGHDRRLLANCILWAAAIIAAAAMGGSALLCTVWLPVMAFVSMLVTNPVREGQCWSKLRFTRGQGGS